MHTKDANAAVATHATGGLTGQWELGLSGAGLLHATWFNMYYCIRFGGVKPAPNRSWPAMASSAAP